MRKDRYQATDPGDTFGRAVLAFPLEAVGASSPRRARLAVAIWTIGLAAIAWIGLVGHDTGGSAKAALAPTGSLPTTTVATAPVDAILATAPPALSRGTVRYISAPTVIRHALGEDGLMGGIVFGTNPASSKVQAEVERDGYRRYYVP